MVKGEGIKYKHTGYKTNEVIWGIRNLFGTNKYKWDTKRDTGSLKKDKTTMKNTFWINMHRNLTCKYKREDTLWNMNRYLLLKDYMRVKILDCRWCLDNRRIESGYIRRKIAIKDQVSDLISSLSPYRPFLLNFNTFSVLKQSIFLWWHRKSRNHRKRCKRAKYSLLTIIEILLKTIDIYKIRTIVTSTLKFV